jgi:hypothetical protein
MIRNSHRSRIIRVRKPRPDLPLRIPKKSLTAGQIESRIRTQAVRFMAKVYQRHGYNEWQFSFEARHLRPKIAIRVRDWLRTHFILCDEPDLPGWYRFAPDKVRLFRGENPGLAWTKN